LNIKPLLIASFLTVFSFVHAQPVAKQLDTLSVHKHHAPILETIIKLINKHHYNGLWPDDSLSSQVFDNFFNFLDPGKLIFLESDIEPYESYRYQMNQFLLEQDLSIVFEISNLHRNQTLAWLHQADSLITCGFDFTVNEWFETDGNKKSWVTSFPEQQDRWRKHLKKQALDHKNAGKTDAEIENILREKYAQLGVDYQNYGANDYFMWFTNSFLRAIDPHTYYMTETAESKFNAALHLSWEGIGLLLTQHADSTFVKRIVPGSPASEIAALKSGTQLLCMSNDSTGFVEVSGWNLDKITQKLKGPRDTSVRLVVQNKGNIRDTIELKRNKIVDGQSGATSEVISITENHRAYPIGVIKIPSFYRDVAAIAEKDPEYKSLSKDVVAILESFRNDSVQGVVIDLRNNGGGNLQESIEFTGLFINEGPVVQTFDAHQRTAILSDHDDGKISYEGPLAVLINRHSASASEIFAAAIQDYHRGIILGERSYGKGTVQQTIDLDQLLYYRPRWSKLETSDQKAQKIEKKQTKGQFGAFKVTIAKFYRVTGNSTQLKGVTPDVVFNPASQNAIYGEIKYESALSWDRMPSAEFTPTNYIRSYKIDKLNKQYVIHQNQDHTLQKLASAPYGSKVSLLLREKPAANLAKGSNASKRAVHITQSKEQNEKLSKDPGLKESLRLLVALMEM
jgi:carboxyl-terminal processing protease